MNTFNENESFELSDYDPNWPRLYEQESDRILDALGERVVEIAHVGSTSVPGLRAKPIIDILVAVALFEPVSVYCRLLAPLGYAHHSHEADDERLFFWKGTPRTHHLHIVEYATWEHQRHLLFRDYLRAHPEIARWYENVKRELAIAFQGNRPAYTKGKTAFIKSIMQRAYEEIADPTIRQALQQVRNEPPHPPDDPPTP